MREKINNQIRAPELRVIDDATGNLGVMKLADALVLAREKGLDLIEISPNATPPIAKIMDYGKFQYEEQKKQKRAKAGNKTTEIKSIQISIGTSEHDLSMKARMVSKWLKEGHRVKIGLILAGRSKYMDLNFLKDRVDRVLKFITENYKIAEHFKKIPKGAMVILEKAQSNENK